MNTYTLDYAGLTELADNAARKLAKDAITNIDLREALVTTKTSNGVRIGDCEITFHVENDERVYSIHFEGSTLSNIALYDTARCLVSMLNSGYGLLSHKVQKIISTNNSYTRARNSVRYHSERSEHYDRMGDYFRSHLNENKLSRDLANLNALRNLLLDEKIVF